MISAEAFILVAPASSGMVVTRRPRDLKAASPIPDGPAELDLEKPCDSGILPSAWDSLSLDT